LQLALRFEEVEQRGEIAGLEGEAEDCARHSAPGYQRSGRERIGGEQ
jgi:hypothetical protein